MWHGAMWLDEKLRFCFLFCYFKVTWDGVLAHPIVYYDLIKNDVYDMTAPWYSAFHLGAFVKRKRKTAGINHEEGTAPL